MNRTELFDYLYDRIENCCSIGYLINQLDKYKIILDDEDMKKIMYYWFSFQ